MLVVYCCPLILNTVGEGLKLIGPCALSKEGSGCALSSWSRNPKKEGSGCALLSASRNPKKEGSGCALLSASRNPKKEGSGCAFPGGHNFGRILTHIKCIIAPWDTAR
jgi:hypothetical protein